MTIFHVESVAGPGLAELRRAADRMSAAQDIHSSPSHGGRKLAVARHAHGVDALGWVLLGFVMGAGAAIAVLMNADIARRGSHLDSQAVVSEAQSVRLHLDAGAQQPALVIQGSPAVAAIAAPPAQAAVQAAVQPAVQPLGSAPPALAAKPSRKLSSAAAEAVADDAAAAGMTSRVQGQNGDLF